MKNGLSMRNSYVLLFFKIKVTFITDSFWSNIFANFRLTPAFALKCHVLNHILNVKFHKTHFLNVFSLISIIMILAQSIIIYSLYR